MGEGQQIADHAIPLGTFYKDPGIVRARIQKSRFGWWASYTNGVSEYTEISSFSFTQKGIERKARKKIKKLQRHEDRFKETYNYYGESK